MRLDRPPKSSIEGVLKIEDVSTLQYAYSESFVLRSGTYLASIIRMFIKSSSPSVQSESLREAIMALACVYMPRDQWSQSYDEKERHCHRAGRVIRKKEHFQGLLSEIVKQNSGRNTSKILMKFSDQEVEKRSLEVYEAFSQGDSI